MNRQEIILVVDDNQDICEVLFDWLDIECGFKVIKLYSGNDALSFLKDNHVDHLVTDVKMPNGSGYDLILGLKKLEISLKTIVVMTGFSDIHESEFRKQGADFFFHKPLDLFELGQILKERSSCGDKAA